MNTFNLASFDCKELSADEIVTINGGGISVGDWFKGIGSAAIVLGLIVASPAVLVVGAASFGVGLLLDAFDI